LETSIIVVVLVIKGLAEESAILKLQNSTPGRPFGLYT
jgi:hypothetical protein